MEPEKKQKQIVSKTAFLHMKLRVGSLLSIFTVATVGFGIIAVACCFCVLNAAFNHLAFVYSSSAKFDGLFFGMIGIGFVYLAYQIGATAKEHGKELVDLKSLYTVVSTADLPAVDSLVRASEKPEQAQADVLLRAAVDVEQTPPAQLLRPVPETITNGVK